jgi:hypothetical protein
MDGWELVDLFHRQLFGSRKFHESNLPTSVQLHSWRQSSKRFWRVPEPTTMGVGAVDNWSRVGFFIIVYRTYRMQITKLPRRPRLCESLSQLGWMQLNP